MTECQNADIRDLLPDLVAGSLSAHDAAVVEAHVASCDACREEVALLHSVRSVRPVPVAIDVAAIVARLVPAVAKVAPHAVTVMAAANDSHEDGVRSIRSARRMHRQQQLTTWRAAAAIAVIAVGGLSVAIARGGLSSLNASLASGDSVVSTVTVATVDSPTARSRSATPAPSGTSNASGRAALSVGELSDFSDDEIEGMIRSLESWDGTANADPVPSVPLVRSSGGTL